MGPVCDSLHGTGVLIGVNCIGCAACVRYGHDEPASRGDRSPRTRFRGGPFWPSSSCWVLPIPTALSRRVKPRPRPSRGTRRSERNADTHSSRSASTAKRLRPSSASALRRSVRWSSGATWPGSRSPENGGCHAGSSIQTPSLVCCRGFAPSWKPPQGRSLPYPAGIQAETSDLGGLAPRLALQRGQLSDVLRLLRAISA